MITATERRNDTGAWMIHVFPTFAHRLAGIPDRSLESERIAQQLNLSDLAAG